MLGLSSEPPISGAAMIRYKALTAVGSVRKYSGAWVKTRPGTKPPKISLIIFELAQDTARVSWALWPFLVKTSVTLPTQLSLSVLFVWWKLAAGTPRQLLSGELLNKTLLQR